MAGLVGGYFVRRYWATKKIGSLEARLEGKVSEVETRAKEIIVEAKEKAALLLVEEKNEERERRKEIDALEMRILNNNLLTIYRL